MTGPEDTALLQPGVDAELTALIERLVAMHGEMVGEAALAHLLGYPSLGAFRQSFKRGRVPVPIFKPLHRRGKFALTRDIAAWMHRCSKEAAKSQLRI